MPVNSLVKQREEKQDNSTSKGVVSNYYEFIYCANLSSRVKREGKTKSMLLTCFHKTHGSLMLPPLRHDVNQLATKL